MRRQILKISLALSIISISGCAQQENKEVITGNLGWEVKTEKTASPRENDKKEDDPVNLKTLF